MSFDSMLLLLMASLSCPRGQSLPADESSYTPTTPSCAGEPPHVQGQSFTLKANGLSVSFCNLTAWTFRQLNSTSSTQSIPVLTPTGYSQVVANVQVAPNNTTRVWPPLQPVNPRCPVVPRGPNGPPAPGTPYGSGFLGTGHGGEYIYTLQLFTVRPSGEAEAINLLEDENLPAGRTWPSGTVMSVVKNSQIGPFRVVENVTLSREGRMTVAANITVEFDNVNNTVNFLYPAMSMFAQPYKVWIAKCANGSMVSGSFMTDDSFTLRANIDWAAVYDGNFSGALYQYPGGEVYKGRKGFWNSFWNRPYDHKLYLQVDPPSSVGASVSYEHSIVPFSAASGTWQEVAASLVHGWPASRIDEEHVTRVDLVDPAMARAWLGHPAVGEASFDCFTHNPEPVFKGSGQYAWPVNGYLFPITEDGQNLSLYIGLYGQGYHGPPAKMLAMASFDGGLSFDEPHVVCGGTNFTIFGTDHLCPDGSAVNDGTGGVHVVFDWSTGLGASGPGANNGLGYMHCSSPVGPCKVAPTPVNSVKQNGGLPFSYRTTYGGTLLRRTKDWLVLTAISTSGNGGGVWGLAALTAESVSGPYTTPQLLLYPESRQWHPHPCEFYPCFAHDQYVYCPCTSLQSNRGYQVLFRALLENATKSSAWEVHQAGSLYHWGGEQARAHGIWGQTFSGFVDSSGSFRIMYPSQDASGIGTINLASCLTFANLTTRGFWVSAPNSDSIAVLPTTRTDFDLNITVNNVLSRPWSLRWNWRGQIGPEGSGMAGLSGSSRSLQNNTALCFDGDGKMSLVQLGRLGEAPTFIVQDINIPKGQILRLRVSQSANGTVSVGINGSSVFSASVPNDGSVGGALAVHAVKGGTVHVTEFFLDFVERPLQRWLQLNAADGVSGGGSAQVGKWTQVMGSQFRDGSGMESRGGPDTMAKWSFVGTAAMLWLPSGPMYGFVAVSVDDNPVTEINLSAPSNESSTVQFSWTSEIPSSHHRHALLLRWLNGTVAIDSVDILPPPFLFNSGF